ncbi:MAG TPA: hypothetical protein VGI95_17090 [Caulobacteraceae bacterium]|jgi:hypothetical protein
MSDPSSSARERSPRSPSLTLRKALDRAAQFFEANKRHAVRVESAVDAWGYGSKSSGGRQAIATLLMYGILQDSGSGADRKVQITDLAFRWLADERVDHQHDALKQIALKPKILAELWESWGAQPPSDAECRSQLRIERGFTEAAAQELLDIYKDNIVFSHLADSGIVSATNPAGSGIEGLEFGDSEGAEPPPVAKSRPSEQMVQMIAGERELTTGILSKGSSFRLVVSGQIGVKEIERLIAKLEIDKEILAEGDDDDGEPASA